MRPVYRPLNPNKLEHDHLSLALFTIPRDDAVRILSIAYYIERRVDGLGQLGALEMIGKTALEQVRKQLVGNGNDPTGLMHTLLVYGCAIEDKWTKQRIEEE